MLYARAAATLPSMDSRSLELDKPVTVQAGVNAVTWPSAAPAAGTVFDSAAAGWPSPARPRLVLIDVTADADVTIVGPVWVAGHRRGGGATAWRGAAVLDSGADIVLKAGEGRAFFAYDLAVWADSLRLATRHGTPLTGAGLITVVVSPVELQGPS